MVLALSMLAMTLAAYPRLYEQHATRMLGLMTKLLAH
jgi:hypothetical protein